MKKRTTKNTISRFRSPKEGKALDEFQAKPSEEDSDFWMRLMKHRMSIIVRVVLVLIVLLLATLFFYFYLKNKEYTTYDVLNRVTMETVSGVKNLRYQSHVFTYSSDGAKCMDAEGNIVWNETFEMQNPMVDICEDVVGIADYNGSRIYVMNTEGILGRIDTGMPIRSFRVSANGIVIAVLEDVKSTPIYVYDASGEKKAYFSTSMKNSGYPLGIGISESGYLVGISYLYVDSGEIKTNIAFYNFGEVGKNETDNLVSGYTYANAIAPEIRFLGDEGAVAIADNRCMFYRGSQKPVSATEVMLQEKIIAVYSSDDYVALVFNDATGEARYRIDVYDASGRQKDSITTDIEYRDIFFNGDKIVVYSETACVIHNIGGKNKFVGNFDATVLTMMPTSSPQRYVLITNEEMMTVELK